MPTAVVERVGRNKVNAPSEPENIGNWTPQYIESCISNKETKSISQELIKTVNSLIPTKKLVDLGNRLLDDYDDKGKIKKIQKLHNLRLKLDRQNNMKIIFWTNQWNQTVTLRTP